MSGKRLQADPESSVNRRVRPRFLDASSASGRESSAVRVRENRLLCVRIVCYYKCTEYSGKAHRFQLRIYIP